MSFWIGVLIFAVGILVSVCLHEAGHLLTAKRFGMKATQYFAGFGSHASAPLSAGGEAGNGDSVRLAELNTPIDDLELSVRSVNSLKNSNIRSLGDLVRQTESQILQVKNFGKKSLNEIADLLERENLNFGMKYEESPDGVRITDQGTPPNRNVATVGADDEEEV